MLEIELRNKWLKVQNTCQNWLYLVPIKGAALKRSIAKSMAIYRILEQWKELCRYDGSKDFEMGKLSVLYRWAPTKSQALKRGEPILWTTNKKYRCLPRPALLLLALRMEEEPWAKAVDGLQLEEKSERLWWLQPPQHPCFGLLRLCVTFHLQSVSYEICLVFTHRVVAMTC